MRTNIDIDDALMEKAMHAGPYSTKKDAVEAGLKLLARQAAYREVLKFRGQLRWEGDDAASWARAEMPTAAWSEQEPSGSGTVDAAPPARPAPLAHMAEAVRQTVTKKAPKKAPKTALQSSRTGSRARR